MGTVYVLAAPTILRKLCQYRRRWPATHLEPAGGPASGNLYVRRLDDVGDRRAGRLYNPILFIENVDAGFPGTSTCDQLRNYRVREHAGNDSSNARTAARVQ